MTTYVISIVSNAFLIGLFCLVTALAPTVVAQESRFCDGPVQPSAATRCEWDTMGEVYVPVDRYWGAQTQRSLENFRIGVERILRDRGHDGDANG